MLHAVPAVMFADVGQPTRANAAHAAPQGQMAGGLRAGVEVLVEHHVGRREHPARPPVHARHLGVALVEQQRIARAGDDVEVHVGGVAVRLRCTGPDREFKDLDFVTSKKGSGDAQDLLRRLGYEPHVGFNAMNARERRGD